MTQVRHDDRLPKCYVIHPVTDGRVRVFGSEAKVVEHICDHLLTSPECDLWALASDGYRRVAGHYNADERWKLARAARTNPGAVREMLRVYVEAIEEAIDDARFTDWRVLEDPDGDNPPVAVAMGLCGVLVIVRADKVVTAYVPHERPAAVRRDAADQGKALPRELCMRRRGQQERDRKREKQREQRTRQECLYYEVFRPAVNWVRQLHHHGRNPWGLPRNDAALLKAKLPTNSKLKYPHWVQLRKQAGTREP